MYAGDLWADILFKGDASNLKSTTDELIYFKQQKTMSILSGSNYGILTRLMRNSLFPLLISHFWSSTLFKEEEYLVYLHKLALVIYFSKNSLISKTIDETNNTVYEYIKTYKDGWQF